MIASKFILDILDLLLDGDKAGLALRPQIPYLTDAEYEYTGVGLFVTFQSDAEIEACKYHEDEVILDGVSITSTDLGIGACATVFISGGVIVTLEIWSYDGDYPRYELKNYVLKQDGAFGSGRKIESSRDH